MNRRSNLESLDNLLTKRGIEAIVDLLPFSGNLSHLNVKNKNIDSHLQGKISNLLAEKAWYNSLSVFLLGYGETGKTSLRNAWKKKDQLFKYFFEPSYINPTRGWEIERLQLADMQVLIYDIGGQHHLSHASHLLISPLRSAFLILSDPLEEGFQEQVLFWLRELKLKAGGRCKPSVFLIFNRADQAGKIRESKAKEIESLYSDVRQKFGDVIIFKGKHWMNCHRPDTSQLEMFLKELVQEIQALQEKNHLSASDISLLPKIRTKTLPQIFYLRTDLVNQIKTWFELSEQEAAGYVDLLLLNHDFFEIPVDSISFVCTNLEAYGKKILDRVISGTKHRYTIDQLNGFLSFFL